MANSNTSNRRPAAATPPTPRPAFSAVVNISITEMADNLVAWYQSATESATRDGHAWYPLAHQIATEIGGESADRYGVVFTSATAYQSATEYGAAIIARLSPRCDWDINVAAARAIAAGDLGRCPGGVLPDHWSAAITIATTGVAMATTIAGDGVKVTTFAESIAHPRRAMALGLVVVDTWAARAALFAPGGAQPPTDPRIETYGDHSVMIAAYQMAAAMAGVSAQALQAIVWVAIRSTWRRRR